jgi:hypothetical protein
MSKSEWDKVHRDYKGSDPKKKSMLVLDDKGATTIYNVIVEGVAKESIQEAVDVSKVIKDMAGNFASDNEAQMKGVQLLKGLATSDDPKSNEFMKKLDKATTAISKEMSGGDKKEERLGVQGRVYESRIQEGALFSYAFEGLTFKDNANGSSISISHKGFTTTNNKGQVAVFEDKYLTKVYEESKAKEKPMNKKLFFESGKSAKDFLDNKLQKAYEHTKEVDKEKAEPLKECSPMMGYSEFVSEEEMDYYDDYGMMGEMDYDYPMEEDDFPMGMNMEMGDVVMEQEPMPARDVDATTFYDEPIENPMGEMEMDVEDEMEETMTSGAFSGVIDGPVTAPDNDYEEGRHRGR